MTSTLVKTRCPAKVNLTFQIVGLLPDGYHEVKTLMQAVSLEDDLAFQFSPGNGQVTFSSVDSSFESSFPVDDSNLIVKAIRKFQNRVPSSSSENIDIRIKKRIPIGAGLAGGSSNAAAALVALNHRCGNTLSPEEVTAIGAALGADVPFCLMGATAIGVNRGDVLAAVDCKPEFTLLLAKPRQLSISTPWAFHEFDKLVLEKRDEASTVSDTTERCAAAIVTGTASGIAPYLVNDLEEPVFHHFEELNKIRKKLEDFGALRARLTGSGPTLYGLFESVHDAENAKTMLDEFQTAQAQAVSPGSVHKTASSSESIYPLDSWVVQSVQLGARVV